MKLSTKHSAFACYYGYVIESIVNTIAPLLYAMFNTNFNISFELLGLIATVNFCVQICADLSSPLLKKFLGARKSTILSEFLCFAGLFLLGLLPLIMNNVYLAILLATIIMAIGGGYSEVFLSPLIQALPSNKKEQRMLILHSFYGFGQSFVIIISTLALAILSMDKWYILPFVWAIFPLSNAILFFFVPFYDLPDEANGEKNTSILTRPIFWLMLVMMISAGATEVVISTWASVFAELGLNINKTTGDIIGPAMFALLMGSGRIVFSKFIKRFTLERCLIFCASGCFISYLIIAFVPNAIVSLIACAFTGFFVSIMWPSTYSLGANTFQNGGSLIFSLFAFGGDIGCALGSYLVGSISDSVDAGKLSFIAKLLPINGTGIRTGILICIFFPLITIVGMLIIKNWQKKILKNK